MLIMKIFPELALIETMVTSPNRYITCSQLSELSAALMSVSDLVLSGEVRCVEGYTGVQFLDATVRFRKFTGGSWRATMLMSMSVRRLPLRRSCWQVGDLLTFAAI